MSDKIITEEIALSALQAFVEKGEIHSDNLALIVPAMKRAINTILPDIGELFARIAERRFARGSAHTYASENADTYIAQEDAAEVIAAAIRAAAKGDGE